MSKHTPGPWEAHYSGSKNQWDIGPFRHCGDIVGFVYNKDPLRRLEIDEQEANARLIAASPRLLEASQTMLAAIDQVLQLAQQHDPTTGYYKQVNPYKILEILQTNEICLKARQSIDEATKGGV